MSVSQPSTGGLSRSTATRAAAGVAAAILLLAWLGAGLAVTNATGWHELWTRFAFSTLVAAVSFTLVGGTVAVRSPGHPVGWLLLGVGGAAVVSLVLVQYATYSGPGGTSTAAAWVGSWDWFLILPMLVLILLVFPDGRPRWAWTRALAWSQVGVGAAGALALAVSPVTFADGIPAWYHNPLSVPGGDHAFVLIQDVQPVGWLAAVVALAARWWRSRGEERRQLRVFAMAGLLAIVTELVAGSNGFAPVGSLIAWPLVAISCAAVVLRWRLYGVSTVLSRTVIGATLTGFIAVTYLVLVTALGALIGHGTVTAIAVTAVIAFMFHPAQRSVRAAAHRFVHGSRPAPQQVLSAFARRAGEVTDDETVLADLAALVSAGIGAVDARISLVVGDGLQPPPLDGPRIAVRDGDDEVGAISMLRRADAEPTPADEALLSSLAALAAPVLRSVQLRAELRVSNTELAASRARLATAATAERRRIERDLHDGAQQRLIAVKLRLGMAARSLDRATHGSAAASLEAAAALDAAIRSADEAIDALRDLVHGIYPSVLDSEGLAAALRGEARNVPLQTTIRDDFTSGLRYPHDIEAAAYFCCLEAVHNAVTHAAASHVDIRLWGQPSRLEFSVTDNGIGFIPGDGHRRGLVNLADRAGALGGQVTVTSNPGTGATVSGWFPSP